jgi:hypothetical protein
MNRTACSTGIDAAALWHRCARWIFVHSAFAVQINVELRVRKRRQPGRRRGLTLMILLLTTGHLQAEPAHFWISPLNMAPAGPDAPAIPGINGNVRFLSIWAQPATVGGGAWNAVINPFKQLENISLNLVATNSSVEFLNNSFVVHNPRLGASRRFEFVHDSSTGLISGSTLPDRITGMQAFSISTSSGFTGIGPSCHPDDPFCAATPSGAPAWLLATVAARTIADSGSAEFRLQIGERGMNHAAELSLQTSVVFGNASDPVYNAGCVSNPTRCPDRQVTLPGDGADFLVQTASSSAAQAMHWQGATGQWSDASWSISGRAPSWTDNALLDAALGQNSVTVSGFQHANHTTVHGGRLHVAGDGSLASEVVVNAGGTISGDGWVASNLTLRGGLAVSGAHRERPFGRARSVGRHSRTLKHSDQFTIRSRAISRANRLRHGSTKNPRANPVGAGWRL